MKLAMSLPERPGWAYVVPGFDFVALLLALVMLTGVVAKETFVDVSLPISEFRGAGLGDEFPVVVVVKHSAKGVSYYVAKQLVEESQLEEAIRQVAEERSTRLVVLRMDQNAPLWAKEQLVDVCRRLDYRCKWAIRNQESKTP